jgi:hypothetical protein
LFVSIYIWLIPNRVNVMTVFDFKTTSVFQKSYLLQLLFITSFSFSLNAQFGIPVAKATSLQEQRLQQQEHIQQQNRQIMVSLGNTPPPTQADIVANIQQQINGQPKALTTEQKQQKELAKLLNETHYKEPKASNYWQTPAFVEKEKPYYTALNQLKAQLTGTKPLSVADAYFEIENAEGNVLSSKKEFKDNIANCANFIKRWMMENKLDWTNNLNVHYALQKFFSDTLSIGKPLLELPDASPTVHLPFYYDFNDYKAEKDTRSYHVSKGFATGNGQCHVLPLMYACIAEALGVPFYLSYAPFHSFISYPDKNKQLHNYETTTNWHISDPWYKDHFQIKAQAEKSGIYLNKLNKKQIVAAAIMDLAYSYKKANGVADGTFLNSCVDFAMNYFPNKEGNIDGWLLRSEINAVQLDRVLSKKGIKNISKAEQLPEAKPYLDKLKQLNNKIEQLGYTEEDPAPYETMIEESKAKHPELQTKNNLEKRNLFIPLNTSPK